MRCLVVIVMMMACFTSCKNNTAKTEKPTPPPIAKSDLSKISQASFLDMLKPYYELKEALVATNAVKADAAAARLMSAAEDTRNMLAANDVKQSDALSNVVDILKNTEALINLKDSTCEKKRASFEKISDEIFAAANAVHLKNSGAYRQYCPMAFNDKGAYWLSDNPEIRNPYFGKKMLECGEVRDSL